MKKEVDVVAALIKNGDKFLLCQRNEQDRYGLLWEFPGGAVEKNESLTEAIEREIKEELDLEIEVHNLIREFSDEDPTLKIKIFLFRCSIKEGRPFAKDCKAFGFFDPLQIKKLSLAPADKKIFMYLNKFLKW